MNLPKANLFLTVLLVVGLLFLFLQNFTLSKSLQFSGKRIDTLEKRPLQMSQTLDTPIAGESGKLEISSVMSYIDQKFSELTGSKTGTPVSTVTPKATVAPVTSKKISYLPIFGGDFATVSTSWVDVVGSNFQFSVSDFGSGSYMTWDAYIWVQGGSGEARVRLFDATNGVAVQGSEIAGSSSTPSIVSSGKLIFFNGNNTYKVQLLSKTSQTVQFDNARLKIVY